VFKDTFIVGVMGGGSATEADIRQAYRLGRLIAENGWILLNGGRRSGIMAASARGAAEAGGLTVGILPDDHKGQMAEHIQIPILTGMGSARNYINVLSSDVVVACPGGAGTLSEIALALKHRKTVILLNVDPGDLFRSYRDQNQLISADTAEQVIALIHAIASRADI
jgi:uncharacterized protein (TIGR00725 family)